MAVLVNDLLAVNAPIVHSETVDVGLNIWSFKITTVPAGGDVEIVGDLKDYVDAFFAEITANLSTEYSGGQIQVFNRTQDNFVGANLLTWAGSAIADALPPTVAALMLGRTTKKNVGGRKYILGCDQDAENTGRWTSAALLLFNNAVPKYVDSFTGLTTGQYDPGVISAIGPPFTFEPFSSGLMVLNNRTQRSRTIGRGS